MPEKEKKRERKKVNYFSPVLSQTPILFYFEKKKKRKDGKKNTWKYFNENSFKEGKRSKTKLRV